MYLVEYSKRADKALGKLDGTQAGLIYGWIGKNLVGCENPRAHGKALTGDKTGLWRYRIGSYRVIAKIDDNKLTVLALEIGHRKEVYR